MVAVEEVSGNRNTSRTELKASDMRLAGKMKVFDTRSYNQYSSSGIAV